MSRKAKFSKQIKQLILKENIIPKQIKQSKDNHQSSFYPISKTPQSYTKRLTPETIQKYSNSKQHIPTKSQQCKYHSKREKSCKNYTSQSRSKRDQLMERYRQVQRQYQVVERHFDSELIKLKLGNDIKSSKVKTLKSKKAPMKLLLEQKSQHQTNKIDNKRQKTNGYQQKLSKSLVSKKNTQGLSGSTITISPLLRLLQCIDEQIKHEYILRLLKHKLTPQNTPQVQKYLFRKYQKLPNDLKLLSQQFDPFIKQTNKIKIQELAEQIKHHTDQVSKLWKSNMFRKFSRRECTLFFETLDFDRQRYIQLKMFVRELSILLKMNLRKRDILKIFNRLSQGNVVTLNSILRELCFE